MKKLIYMILLIVLCNSVQADEKVITNKNIKNEITAKTICLSGFVFAVVYSNKGFAITQIFRKYNNFGTPQTPLTCAIKKYNSPK